MWNGAAGRFPRSRDAEKHEKRERKRVFCFRDLKLKKNDARSLS